MEKISKKTGLLMGVMLAALGALAYLVFKDKKYFIKKYKELKMKLSTKS